MNEYIERNDVEFEDCKIDYIYVLKYLENNQENPYSNPDGC